MPDLVVFSELCSDVSTSMPDISDAKSYWHLPPTVSEAELMIFFSPLVFSTSVNGTTVCLPKLTCLVMQELSWLIVIPLYSFCP